MLKFCHTVTHCLYRVGQGVCPLAHSTAGPSVAWHGWVGGRYRLCVEQRAVESKKKENNNQQIQVLVVLIHRIGPLWGRRRK